MRIETRPATVADLHRAAEVLGEAFADYAWTRWTVDADDHERRVTELQRTALQHLGLVYGRVWVSSVGGRVHSVSVRMDSAVVVPSRVGQRLQPTIRALEGSRHEASVAAEAELRGWRPRARHLYLATIGTTPAMQGKGLATRALAPVLDEADAEGVGVFVETSSASNVTFYSRLGFAVTGRRRVGADGPRVWAMLRPPSARVAARGDGG